MLQIWSDLVEPDSHIDLSPRPSTTSIAFGLTYFRSCLSVHHSMDLSTDHSFQGAASPSGSHDFFTLHRRLVSPDTDESGSLTISHHISEVSLGVTKCGAG